MAAKSRSHRRDLLSLDIAGATLMELARLSRREEDRLVKRMITAGGRDVAAGFARLTDEPALHFMLVVADEDVEDQAEPVAEPAGGQQAVEEPVLGTAEREAVPPASDVTQPASAPVELPEVEADAAGPIPAPDQAETVATVAPSPQPDITPPAPEPAAPDGPVRFVWRTDAEGRFSTIGEEFVSAVGAPAADVIGEPFAEAAERLGLDPTGEIAGLLGRRDTWSGRAVLWPIAGTDLSVPVDLAALPVYGRGRVFEGFRGFGVARMSDALVDPQARGLALLPAAEPSAPEASPEPSIEDQVAEPAMAEAEPASTVVALDIHRAAPLPALSTSEKNALREIGERLRRDADVGVPADEPAAHEEPAATQEVIEAPEQQGAPDLADGTAAAEVVADELEAMPFPAELSDAPAEDVTLPDQEAAPASDAAESEIVGDEEPAQTDVQPVSHQDTETQEPLPLFATETASEPVEIEAVQDAVWSGEEEAAPQTEDQHPHAVDAAVEEPVVQPEPTVPARPPSLLSVIAEPDEDIDEQPEAAVDTVAEEPAAPEAAEPEKAEPEASAAPEMPSQAAGQVTDESQKPAGDRPVEIAARDFMPSAFALPSSGTASPGIEAEVLERLPLLILIHAGDVLHYANREFLRLTGYEDIEALADAGGIDAVFAEPDWEADAGRQEGGKLRLISADGLEFAVDAHLQRVPWHGGQALLLALQHVEAVAAPAVPVAEVLPFRQPDRAALEEHIAEMRAIIDTATDGVVIIDNDGNVRSISRPAEALFGIDTDEIAGQPFTHLFAIESQRAARDYLVGLSDNGVASVLNDGREVIGREAQGRFIPLFMTIGRLPNQSGYCAVVRDITQWKRAEEELTQARSLAERASSQKTDFLARVSHEIRTPLNAIIGFSELMMDEKFGPIGNDRYRDYLRDINRSGNHVLDLVNDLLDISKIEAGEQEMNYEAVSLNDALAEAVAMMQPQANRDRVIIRSSFASRLPDVVADLRSVRQIALNLMSNAIRYTQAGGQVIVSTSYEPTGDITVRIRDTGIGMSSAEIDQALKPFKQVNALKRQRGDGTGLGLPLTKAMVEANRARFAISSTPGIGTLVEITFPSTRVLAE